MPGTNPAFIEGDVFKTIVPLETKDNIVSISVLGWDKVRKQLGDRLGDRLGTAFNHIEGQIAHGALNGEWSKNFGHDTKVTN